MASPWVPSVARALTRIRCGSSSQVHNLYPAAFQVSVHSLLERSCLSRYASFSDVRNVSRTPAKRLFLCLVLCLKKTASNVVLGQPPELLNCQVCKQNAILCYKGSALEATMHVSNHHRCKGVGGIFFQLKLRKLRTGWSHTQEIFCFWSIIFIVIEQPPGLQTWQTTYKRERELGMKYTLINNRVFLPVLNVSATREWKVMQSPGSQRILWSGIHVWALSGAFLLSGSACSRGLSQDYGQGSLVLAC